MMKRIISFLLICSLLLIPNTYTKADGKVQSYGDFEYEISTNNNKEKEVVICGYTGTNEIVDIPETIAGEKVVGVSKLDGSNTKITTVRLAKYVERVSSLLPTEKYEVVEDNPNFSVENGVLFNKDKTKLLIYPTEKKDEKYVEPASVTKSEGANDNKYVKQWTFSSNKENKIIKDFAYSGCPNLEKIVIPSNIVILGEFSFAQCKKLKTIVWNKTLQQIGDTAFFECSSLENIKIPNTVFYIGKSAFSKCNIKNLKLSKRLKYIESFAFSDNSMLKKVEIPNTVVKMRKNAFPKTTKIKKASYLSPVADKDYYCAKAIVTTTVKNKKKKRAYKEEKITKIKGKKKQILQKGKSVSLKTQVYINKKLIKNGALGTNILSFKSSNPKVATVSSKGKVKAKKRGAATIYVTLMTKPESYEYKGISEEGTIIVEKIKEAKKSYKVVIKVK